MNTCKLSIIIPVYNAEKYLSRCITSILIQPLLDFEVLLIDDGSKDDSFHICESFEMQDKRIRVVHKYNGGVSSARNAGIERASGEYLTFVDSDDFLEPETLNLSIFDGNYDVIRIPCNRNSENYCIDNEIMLNSQQAVESALKKHLFFACWGRLYKRSIIGNIRFREDLRMGEDLLFFIEVLPYVNSFHVIPGNVGYNYEDNSDSVTKRIGLGADIEKLFDYMLMLGRKGNPYVWKPLFLLYSHNCMICNLQHVVNQKFKLQDLLNKKLSFKLKMFFIKSILSSII